MDTSGRILRKDIVAKFGHTWVSKVSFGFVLHVVGMNLASYVDTAAKLKWPVPQAKFDARTFDALVCRICNLIWLEVLDCLHCHGDGAQFVLACESCLEILLAFLFPPCMRWKRKAETLERLCAVLFVAKTLVWLRLNLTCGVAIRLFPVFPPRIQAALLGDSRSARWLVAWYRDIFSARNLGFGACVYLWFTRSFEYIGMAKLRRTASQGIGPVHRLFEHLVLCCRQHAPHASYVRYKMARRQPLWKHLWLPIWQGAEPLARAAESLLIKSFRPNANFVPQPAVQYGTAHRKSRKRPPKFVRLQQRRRVGFLRVGRSVWSSQLWENALSNVERWVSNQRHGLDNNFWRSMSFHEAYRFQQQILWVAFGQFGPVNLYELGRRRLVALWLTCKHSQLDLPRLRALWACDSVGVVLDGLCKNILAAGRRRLAFAAVRKILQLEGLPSKRMYTITVPEKFLVGVVRTLIFQMARSSTKWPSPIRTWALRKTRVVVGARCSFKNDLSHARFARQADISSAFDFSESCLMSGISGVSMSKVSAHIDTAKRRPIHEICQDVACLVNNWARWSGLRCGFCSVPLASSVLSGSYGFAASVDRLDSSSEQYLVYTRDLRADAALVRVPDDKDRTSLWLVPPACYTVLLLVYSLLAPTWKACSFSVQEANLIVALILLRIIPPRLHKWLQLDSDVMWLPYVYMTVKSKCYGPTGRVCQKLWHSCCRKIISYCRWPARKNWRLIGRGLDIILRASGKGFEIRDMSVAARNLLSDIRELQPGRICNICERCGQAKYELTGVVCDAGQFFEMVTPQDALASVREIMHGVASSTGKDTVTVFKKKKVAGFLGGSAGFFRSKSVTFTFYELLFCFWASLMVSFCYVGNLVFRLSGLPIGGLLSRVASGFVLALDESKWTSSVETQRESGFYLPDVPWYKLLVCRRYIDDLLILSRVWCYDCLCVFPSKVYRVPFDPGPRSRSLVWLDLVVNLDSITLGVKSSPIRVPPPWDVSQQKLRNFFWAKISRYRQLELPTDVWQEDVVFQLVTLASQGFCRRRLRNLVFSMYKMAAQDEMDFLKAVVCTSLFKGVCASAAARAQ